MLVHPVCKIHIKYLIDPRNHAESFRCVAMLATVLGGATRWLNIPTRPVY